MTTTQGKPVPNDEVANGWVTGRVPPHNIEAEESLLGAMLLTTPAITSAVDMGLTPEDFYKPAHGHIFEAVTALHAQGEPTDPVTVAEQLRGMGQLMAVGGSEAMTALQLNTPAIGNASRYAKIVQDHSLFRSLIARAGEIAEIGYAASGDAAAAVDAAEALLTAVDRRRRSETTETLRGMLEGEMDRLEAVSGGQGDGQGVPTGYTDFDKMTLGFNPGLVVVGSRPSTGKTAWATTAAVHAATRAAVPTHIFSLEMSRAELTQRMLACEAQVSATRIRKGDLDEFHWQRLARATGRLAEAPLWVDDDPYLTMAEVGARARRAVKTNKVGLVVLDYIQLVAHSHESQERGVAEVSRGLKLLSRELQVPVVAMSQLSRELERRADKRPVMADLRSSGSLEQDADVVVLLHRPEVYDPNTQDKGMCEVIVAKNRNGPTGTVRLAFANHQVRFANMGAEV